MKKLFNYALLAAALLVGVNANAVDFVVKDAGGADKGTKQSLSEAIALINVKDATGWTITVSANYTVPEGTYDLKGAELKSTSTSTARVLTLAKASTYSFSNGNLSLINFKSVGSGTTADKLTILSLENVNGATLYNGYTDLSVNNSTLTITGGTYLNEDIETVRSCMAEGKYLFRKASTCVVGTTEQATAKIGEELFLTVADAFACAQENETIVLLAEATGQAAKTIDKNITIDFNGFNYGGKDNVTPFTVSADKTLTLNNNGGNQVTVTSQRSATATKVYYVAKVSGNLVVDGDIVLDASATGAAYDVSYTNKTAGVTVDGATFKAAIYANNATRNILDGEDVSNVTITNAKAKIDNVYYYTQSTAFTDVQDDETIVLLANATDQAAKTIDKNITIDFNGFNYGGKDNAILFTVNADKTLTLNNNGGNQVTVTSQHNNTTGYYVAKVSGNLVVDGDIVFDASATGAKGDISIATDGASVTINGDAKVSVYGTMFGYLDGDSQNITIAGGGRFWTLPEHYTMDPALSGKEYMKTQSPGGNEYWLLVDKSVGPIAELNGTKYYVLGDALNAAEDGETVTLCFPSAVAITYVTANFYSGKKVTLDLNGKTLTTSTVDRLIRIYRGELTITGQGKLSNTYSGPNNDKDGGCIQVYGSHKPLFDASGEPLVYSKLVIEENVEIEGETVGIDVYTSSASYITAGNDLVQLPGSHPILADFDPSYFPAGAEQLEGTRIFMTDKRSTAGLAENVFVEVKGTVYGFEHGVQTSGNLKMPRIAQPDGTTLMFVHESVQFDETQEDDYMKCVPHIHIYPTAKCGAGNSREKNDKTGSGVYAAGYGVWLIEGECYGASGVYIKSGDIDIDGAYIYSTWEQDYKETVATGSSTESGGNGVVVESNSSYKGETSVTIEGDTKIQGGSGYGIQQKVTTGDPDQLDFIDIQGGEIGKGGEGTFVIDVNNVDDVTISAGSSETGGAVETWTIADNTDPNNPITTDVTVDQFIPTDPQSGEPTSHIIYVYNESGELAFVVVVPGAAPQKADCGSFDLTAYAGQSIDFAECAKEQALEADLTLEEVIMNSATEAQKVIVNDGVTLTIKYLIMGPKSNITVEPGGTLIVDGDMGVKNVSAANITIQAQEGKSGKFLFAPEVKSNRHPHATVTFFSKAFTNSKADQQQDLIGIPMLTVKKITMSDNNYAAVFDVWRKTYWDRIGGINFTPALDYNKFDVPFSGYCIYSSNPKDVKLSYDISGELLGNTEPSSVLILKGWTSSANSWTGDVNVDAFLKALKDNKFDGLTQSIYLASITGSHIIWNAVNGADEDRPENIEPMQAMMINNTGNQAVDARILTYKELVWDPVMAPAPAPRRAPMIADKVTIKVTSEAGVTDRVIVGDMDVDYCAPKQMSNPVCVYAHAGENYDILATSTVANTYVGFNCEKEGIYTISFGKVNGTYALLDLMNNARIEMTEGATYQFNANANEKNEYRFMIVESAKVPTAMDKVDAKANAVKVISNGEFRIVKENRVYNAMGEEL